MRYSLRFCVSVCFIMVFQSAPVVAAEKQLVLLVGGDVEWSLNSRPPTVRYHIVDPRPFGFLVFEKRDVRDQVIDDWPLIPYVNFGESKAYLESLHLKAGKDGDVGESLSYPLEGRPENVNSTDEKSLNYPLQRLAPTFHAADLVFVNCEGALSDHSRQVGINRTPEKFAMSMRSAGISLVTVANNHSFDAEEKGFLDTLRALDSAGIHHVGGGHDLDEARKPFIFQRNGIKIGFIGYAQFNNFGEAAFAADGRPGIAPMDPFLIKEDIRRLKPQVDYVVVTMHWSTSRSREVSPANRQFAHDLIDAGADLVLGHHPPHPKGIEVYHGKVIIYAPSNVLRGHTNLKSDDGYLARLTLGPKSVEKVEVLPIAGKGQPEGWSGQAYDATLFQPFLIQGSSARQLLEDIRTRSAGLDTKMEIDGDKGVITVASASK